MSAVTSALPRFTGPAQARQRMRLIAALGMLAIAAITAGGLASLTAGRPVVRVDEPPATPPTTSSERRAPVDMAAMIEVQLEGAEHEVQSARAMIRMARRLGMVDDRQLEQYERRLDRIAGRPPEPVAAPSSPREPSAFDRRPRAL